MPVMRRPPAVWRLEVIGVRLGVLALLLPVAGLAAAYVFATRGLFLHPPDSRYYMTMIARDQGDALPRAIARSRGVVPWRLAPWYFAQNDPTWQLVKVRALYPFLSVPFAAVFGLKAGSLIVPALSLLAFVWVTAALLQRLYSPAVAVVVVGGFTVTATIPLQLWATTDMLALALSAVLVANLPIERAPAPAHLVWLGAATVFIALTRQVGVLAPAMAGCGWLWAAVRERRLRNRWLGPLAVTVAVAGITQYAVSLVAHIDTSGILAKNQTTFGGAVSQFFRNAGTVSRQDNHYLWSADRVLYLILGAAFAIALVKFARDFAAVFFGALLATYVLIAGTGLASDMRYEMILFPAAAVSAGAFVAWALDQRGSPFAAREETTEADTAPLRRPVWIPQFVGCSVLLIACLVVTALGGSGSTVTAPASPSAAAAQAGRTYSPQPLATPSAEVTLRSAFAAAMDVADGGDVTELDVAFDWTHDLRYRPTGPGDPDWIHRAADGTTITRRNAMSPQESVAFAGAISLGRSVVPQTLEILSRTTSRYGEDVAFQVEDGSGAAHRGTATTMYPVWDPKEPGIVTALVFAP